MGELTIEQQKLLTVKGFDAEFFKNLAISKTHYEAYDKTEELYRSYFGRNRYSSFNSYRNARDNRIKNK